MRPMTLFESGDSNGSIKLADLFDKPEQLAAINSLNLQIKLGGDTAIEHGVTTLKALEKKIDTDRMKALAFLMVLTAVGDYAYRRADGVYVVPIGCLRD